MAVTELTLNADSTFYLVQPDPVFTDAREKFHNAGSWTVANNEVILNPGKHPLPAEVRLAERVDPNTDSITIKVNYMVRSFKNEALMQEAPFDFDMLTVYINKRKNIHHLVRYHKHRTCAFAPNIRHQVIIGPENTFRLPRTTIQRIGFLTYGFDGIVWREAHEVSSNFFEIDIVQSIDEERTPRSRKVLIKGDKAYYYMRNGQIDTSLMSLQRRD